MTDPAGETPSFTVLAGNPTEVELAALTAVVTAMAEEVGDRALTTASVRPGAWERSQRHLRTAIIPGPGAWNSGKF